LFSGETDDLSPSYAERIKDSNIATTTNSDFGISIKKSDENDENEESQLLTFVPKKFKKQGQLLIEQFEARPNEFTWNSNGVIFINQTPIPNSNIFVLFPLLFKANVLNKKKYSGFEELVNKISDMNLEHLILKNKGKKMEKKSEKSEDIGKVKEQQKVQWWYIGD